MTTKPGPLDSPVAMGLCSAAVISVSLGTIVGLLNSGDAYGTALATRLLIAGFLGVGQILGTVAAMLVTRRAVRTRVAAISLIAMLTATELMGQWLYYGLLAAFFMFVLGVSGMMCLWTVLGRLHERAKNGQAATRVLGVHGLVGFLGALVTLTIFTVIMETNRDAGFATLGAFTVIALAALGFAAGLQRREAHGRDLEQALLDLDRYDYVGSRDKPLPSLPNHLVWAIISIAVFFLPAGIVAVVYATQVGTALAAGDFAGAVDASRKARIWCWVSTIVAVVGWTIGLVFWLVILTQLV